MKKLMFYHCPQCGSIFTGMGNAEFHCCGQNLPPLTVKKMDDFHKPEIEIIEEESYITVRHPMDKKHYLTFIAYAAYDRVLLVPLYPEQNAELRIPTMRKGKLYVCCSVHGLFQY